MNSERWEHGSELHSFPYNSVPQEGSPWEAHGLLMGSGRDCLRALLFHGRSRRGWRRLWLPGYFCQEVVAALSEILPLVIYDDTPLQASAVLPTELLHRGDVVLWVNFFGLRSGLFTGSGVNGVEVIEDYTHDPWAPGAWGDTADWCVASLRKTLPVPDGGALWSPRGHELPPAVPVTEERQLASLEKLAGMYLKSLYLAGHRVDKEAFRSLAMAGEANIASGKVSAMPAWTVELLKSFPVRQWREQRSRNFAVLHDGLAGLDGISVLFQSAGADVTWPPTQGTPFSCILVCGTPERRETVRRALIMRKVYPAVLWPLEVPAVQDIPQAAVDLSRRVLALHCDMRYSADDMEHLVEIVRECATGEMA
jgi:hypothetical protein